MASFENISYKKHSAHFDDYAAGGPKAGHARTWLNQQTVNAWRHARLYQTIDPILRTEPGAKWLTVGDGRYGGNAMYINENGGDATASDISDVLLKEARDMGYILKFSRENAEDLSFSESEFDYVLCKESYHHFPRPMLALYEMLRVAGKAVILIEPNDTGWTKKMINGRRILEFIKSAMGRKQEKHLFEESGNYVYSVSKREIEKAALGLNYPAVAFKGVNDAYYFGVEYEMLADRGPLHKKTKNMITLADVLCRLGLLEYGILTAVIFKKDPSTEMSKRLSESGFDVIKLPSNPHSAEQPSSGKKNPSLKHG